MKRQKWVPKSAALSSSLAMTSLLVTLPFLVRRSMAPIASAIVSLSLRVIVMVVFQLTAALAASIQD